VGVTYQKADDEVHRLVAEVIEQDFPDLKEVEVRVDLLMAFAARNEQTGEPQGYALKLHGVPCLAVIKVNNIKDRVAGLGDCRITFDGDRFVDLPDRKRRGLIHHELMHLVVARDSEGGVRTDDAFRPVLKTRNHDIDLGAFFATVKKYGEDAPETDNYKAAHREFTQLLLPYG
jgi:hypothetical protein